VKAYALEAAMNDFAAAVGPETMIFPVLNGMRHIDILTNGSENMRSSAASVSSRPRSTTRVASSSSRLSATCYGERNGEITPRLKALDATLQGAGFDARLSPEIMQAMWEKWVQLASLAPLPA